MKYSFNEIKDNDDNHNENIWKLKKIMKLMKKKIKEIEGKIAAMEKVLNVDISEKNYLQYLEKKINNNVGFSEN